MDRRDDVFFSLLYRRWAPRVFNHFRRLSWTVDDAADLTADVFAIALEHLSQVRDNRRVGGWLWTIAHRQAAGRARSDQRRRQREQDAVACTETGPRVPAGDRSRLQRAMRALDTKNRQLLLWREYSGLSYREIANLTGQTIEGVRASLYRARRRLREEYLKRGSELR